jgi:hypothetical protein
MGSTLVDDLIDVTDDIRELADDFGTRPFKVELVTVTWSGRRRGEGVASEVATEIKPRPEFVDTGLRAELRGNGRDEEGNALLRGVSLRYAAGELYALPGDVGASEERFYRITDTRGQGAPPRHYLCDKPPTPRRGDGLGDQIDWIVSLRRRSDPDPVA